VILRRELAKAIVVGLAVLLFAGAAQAGVCPIAGQKSMLIVQMFFGQGRDVKDETPDKAWQDFMKDDVTPRFPDGFTVFDAYGQWRNPATAKIGREKSKMVEIALIDAPDTERKISELASIYRIRFHQESVGIVTTPGCGAF
jgi:hypothetical protein